MSQQEILFKVFEFVILLFSLSLHEAAHAWTASRLGDQTARMLGRVTLNPMKHIDPVGTVLLPVTSLFLFGGYLFGWARPTPVNTRNFKNYRQGDVLTTLAGPASNLLAAIAALVVLVVLAKANPVAVPLIHGFVMGAFDPEQVANSPALFPSVLLLGIALKLNVVLAVFNLIPLPPLDGSHIVRHLLPYNALRFYDQIGVVSLFLIVFFGQGILRFFVDPLLGPAYRVLLGL
jgi:Zn-dependent protease